jgi:hypothetical protein
VTVPLSRFLDVWLPKIATPEDRAIVVALCNPRHVPVARPAAAGSAVFLYGLGDVDSSRDEIGFGTDLYLLADEWRTA